MALRDISVRKCFISVSQGPEALVHSLDPMLCYHPSWNLCGTAARCRGPDAGSHWAAAGPRRPLGVLPSCGFCAGPDAHSHVLLGLWLHTSQLCVLLLFLGFCPVPLKTDTSLAVSKALSTLASFSGSVTGSSWQILLPGSV